MIESLINKKSVIMDLSGTERDEVLAELTECLLEQENSLNRNEVLDALIAREDKMSTMVGLGIAVPHAVCKSVSHPVIALGLSHSAVEFNTMALSDEEIYAKVIFCVVFPEDKPEIHLEILKDILMLEKHNGFIEKVLKLQTETEVCNLIEQLGYE